ncbi:MAG: carbohydrate-binding protein [Firmicutes bacterium]|nr:carbohydrate-binding protein [Bacillota bacterium]
MDWNEERQVIDGFGGSGAFHQAANLRAFPERDRELILDLLFSQEKGIGLSIVRNIIGDGGDWGEEIDGATPSIEPEEGVWNWSGDEDQIWLMQEARRRGCDRFMSTAWSPPAWMKTNNSVINGGELRPDKYQAFAEYLVKYVQGYKEHHGLEIYAISPANEPDLTTGYSSCRWTGEQLREFIKDYLTPTLQREGVSVKVIIPETMNFGEDYALATLNDAEASQGVDIIGTHAYDFKVKPFPVAKSQNKAIWQTEVSNIGFNDGSIDDGLKYAKLLHDHLTVTEVNAWLFWWLAAYKPGEALIHIDPALQTFTTFKRLYTIGNYSRFVRPGYVRIDANPHPVAGVMVTAFKDPTGGKFALVAINSNEQEQEIKFVLEKFPEPEAVIPYRTSDRENLVKLPPLPVVNGEFTAKLKGKSVTTFIPAAYGLPGELSLREVLTPLMAADFDEQSGVEVETTATGEPIVVFKDPGGYVFFQNYNFANGTASCELRVHTQGRGKLEIMLHNPVIGLPLARYSVLAEDDTAEETWKTVVLPTEQVRGVNDFYLVYTPWDEGAFCKVDWLEFKAPEKIPLGKIKVQMTTTTTALTTNELKPEFKIINSGEVPVNLAEVKVRYYYTMDGTGSQAFTYSGGSLPAALVTGTLVPMTSVTPDANYYLEIGFTGEAGHLKPGEAIELATVITSLGEGYRQDNDFSFRSQAEGMSDWAAVPGYVKDQLCWGSEPSLLHNAGFETGTTDGWFNFGEATVIMVTDQTAHTGNYAALVSNRSETWQGIAQDLRDVMEPGQTYEISAWLKLKNKMNDAGRLSIKRTDQRGDNYSWVDSKTVNDEEWTMISGTYTLNVEGTLQALELYTEGPAAGVDYYVDNVVVRQVRPEGPPE